MKYCSNKEINSEVIKRIQTGWIFRRGGKHGKLFSPNGKLFVTIPCTPSDPKCFWDFRRNMKYTEMRLMNM